MTFYFAPLEGVAGHIYRRAFHQHFDQEQISKYFAPFIVADQKKKFTTRDQNDIDPLNNKGIKLIPQILTNNGEDYLHTAYRLSQLGYDEININLGCPSGTVVSKKRGSGFLAYPEELDRFLEAIFNKSQTAISIKTRIGRDDPTEFNGLMAIYNRYPLKELIIHPRVQKDLYRNKPNLEVFREALLVSKNPVCYNGDIFTPDDFNAFTAEFPEVKTMMLGRGLLANPHLIHQIEGHKKMDRQTLRSFHDQVYRDYKAILFGDRNVLFKMKEVWFYLIQGFTQSDKVYKKIKKVERLSDYDSIIDSLFNEHEILDVFGHRR